MLCLGFLSLCRGEIFDAFLVKAAFCTSITAEADQSV